MSLRRQTARTAARKMEGPNGPQKMGLSERGLLSAVMEPAGLVCQIGLLRMILALGRPLAPPLGIMALCHLDPKNSAALGSGLSGEAPTGPKSHYHPSRMTTDATNRLWGVSRAIWHGYRAIRRAILRPVSSGTIKLDYSVPVSTAFSSLIWPDGRSGAPRGAQHCNANTRR